MLSRQLPPARRDWQRLLSFGCWLLLVVAICRPFIQTEGIAPIANLAGRVLVIDLGGDAAYFPSRRLAATELLKRHGHSDGDRRRDGRCLYGGSADAGSTPNRTLHAGKSGSRRDADGRSVACPGHSRMPRTCWLRSGVLAGQVVVLTGGNGSGRRRPQGHRRGSCATWCAVPTDGQASNPGPETADCACARNSCRPDEPRGAEHGAGCRDRGTTRPAGG